jgi:hypothetical protein
MASVMAIPPIASDFTKVTPIHEQRQAHERAKAYLCEQLPRLGATIRFIRSAAVECPDIDSISIDKSELDPEIFKWEATAGVQYDIVRDGSRRSREEEEIVLYGVASQFNGCEAPGLYTVRPGDACVTYVDDHTQGPYSQLQFHPAQVEAINAAGNIGLNGLVYCLDDERRGLVEHGFLHGNPRDAPWLIEQLKGKGGQLLEYCCISNIPMGTDPQLEQRPVHIMLVSAPANRAWHRLDVERKMTLSQKTALEFLCAFRAFDAQFEACLSFLHREQQPATPVLFKPTAVGLGAFRNEPLTVAKAFYAAALIFQSKLREEDSISVRWQAFHGSGPAREVATYLQLPEVV